LYDDTRLLDTLVCFGELKGLLREEERRSACGWLARMDLSGWVNRKIERLSKGMQQKVQFLAAILHRPDLIVLYEPFAGLDPVHQDLFKEIIRDLRDEGMTILLSSHQMNRIEELCDRIFLIHRGRQVLYGNLEQIKEAHGTHAVRLRFTGDGGCLENDTRTKDLKSDGDLVTFTLPEGVDPDTYVCSIPESMILREIAVERPPPHDIFVQTVSGGDHESA
jgi:ABC-2 type transport system ATP-binding protein